MKILSIVGARPNFMKIASIDRAVKEHNKERSKLWIEHIIVHTGQHYDEKMSSRFFEELEIPIPHVNLEVGSASHAVQTAQIMERIEPILLKERPDVLLVVGDVNSTIACTLVASKIEYGGLTNMKRPLIAHVEAGLRSFDRDMPEEINRILTDALSDFLFTTEKNAITNLKREGIPLEKIYFVGNVMIDTLISHKEKAANLNILETILNENSGKKETGEAPKRTLNSNAPIYGVVTLHRPSNVDTLDILKPLIYCIKRIASRIPIILPLHPRTRSNLIRFGLYQVLVQDKGISLTKPLGYLEFLNLLLNAAFVLTDSGGIQEETTYLNVPCITMRNNTERPVTVTMGTNCLVGTDPDKIFQSALSTFNGKRKKSVIPPLWDGKTGDRILEILVANVTKVKQNELPACKLISNNYRSKCSEVVTYE